MCVKPHAHGPSRKGFHPKGDTVVRNCRFPFIVAQTNVIPLGKTLQATASKSQNTVAFTVEGAL